MINYEGMKAEESGRFEQLPAGPYVAQVKAVKVDGAAPDQTLVMRLEVAEGDYAGYFGKRYQHDAGRTNSAYPAKYKGDYRLRVPNPANQNSRYPESDKRRFNDMIFRMEKSNPGYHWDGDENKLVGKLVGINMQEDSYNGSVFTRIGRLEIADDVRNGLVKAMAPRKPRDEAESASSDPFDRFTQVEAASVDCPF